MLKIALPAGKSLEQRTCDLFGDALISIDRADSAHSVSFPNYPMLSEGRFVKPRRAPLLVASGDFDIGITGKDAVLESRARVEICAELPYSRYTSDNTRGVLFAHVDDPVNHAAEIPPGSRILSEYPKLTRAFFAELGIRVKIVDSPGSAEAEIPFKYRFGLALSETGRSLRENGLKTIATVFESCTVLVANKQALRNKKKAEAIHAFTLILRGVLEARDRVLLSMNVPNGAMEKVLKMLPALHSPTIAELAGGQFHSVSTVVPKNEVNTLIPALLKMGAEGILITPVSSVIQSW